MLSHQFLVFLGETLGKCLSAEFDDTILVDLRPAAQARPFTVWLIALAVSLLFADASNHLCSR